MSMIESLPPSEFDRLPPHDIEAEQCVLSAMMIAGDDRGAFAEIRTALHRDWFYQTDHQVIFDALCKLDEQGKAIDAVMVRAQLDRMRMLEECGGSAYLANLLHILPSYAHGPHYAAIVREKALLRSAIATANKLLRRAYAPARSVEAADAICRDAAGDLAAMGLSGDAGGYARLSEVLDEVLDQKTSGKITRIPTGISDLDDVIGGLPIGEFVIIAARPSVGKSALEKEIASRIADSEKVGIVTIEESSHKVARNILSNSSGIENRKLAYGNLGPEEWDEIGKALPGLMGKNLWIDEHPVKLSQVEQAVTIAAVKHECRAVFVDYLQLVEPDEGSENENREITLVSRKLKRIAKRLNICLVALCQLNRGSEMGSVGRPTLRNLRGSGSLEQDGDLVMLLHREDYYHRTEPSYAPDHKMEVLIEKHKDGPAGVVPLYFDGRIQRISNWNNGYGG